MSKKKLIRLGTVILSLLILIYPLSACGTSGNQTVATHETPAVSAEAPAPEVSAPQTAEAPEEAPAEAPASVAESGDFVLPIVEEPVTLSLFAFADSNLMTVAQGYHESIFFQQLEERTNVHIEFEVPAAGSNQDAFNLMIASGDLPDMVAKGYMYQNGFDASVEDGYFIDLVPYMDEYLPNYKKRVYETDDKTKLATTDGGRTVAFYQISKEDSPPFRGLMMRKDWLDDLNLEVPVTVDEWETVLNAFKNEKGAYAPLADGADLVNLGEAFNVSPVDGFINIDGKVVYSIITEDCREFLRTMSDWYQKGLLDPDFMTRDPGVNGYADDALVISGQSGVFSALYTWRDLFMESTEDSNMDIIAVKGPIPHEGYVTKLRQQGAPISTAGGMISITTECENVEVALKWNDYLYSDEGSLFAMYGVEGDTFEYVDDKPRYTAKIYDNPDGMAMAPAMSLYCLPPGAIGSYYDRTRELTGMSQESIDMQYVWDEITGDYVFPRAQMNSEENAEYSTYYADISAYAKENMAMFVSGMRDIETEWDDFVAQINSLGIERCIEIRQASLDRFNSR